MTQAFSHLAKVEDLLTPDCLSICQTFVLIADLKFDNLQYYILARWLAGINDSLTKHPIYVVFHNFLQNSLQKLFQFIILCFYKFTKIIIKSFECPKSITNYEKKQCLEH